MEPIFITAKTEPFECGMCGPSARIVVNVRCENPRFKQVWRQSMCDNGDQIDEATVLTWVLEQLGYDARIKWDW